MKTRDTLLPEPPMASPFVRVRVPVHGKDVVLRVPSLHRVAQLGKAANPRSFAAVMAAVSTGAGVLGAIKVAQESGAELLELMGAFIGIAWADPVLVLETPPLTDFSPPAVLAYGGAVFEELDAAGWRFEWVVACAIALGNEVSDRAALTQEALGQARFFGRRTAPSTGPSSSATSSSSADGSAPSTS